MSTQPLPMLELRDQIAKAIADSVGHGMREKCEKQADAVLSVVMPQLTATADHAVSAHLSAQAKVRVTGDDVDTAATAYWADKGASMDNLSADSLGRELKSMRAALESFAARLSQGAQGEAIDGQLSSRLRPDVECAPWVIDEVRKIEARIAERAAVPDGLAYWAAVTDDGEIVVSYSADDGNNGEAGRKECNDYINDALLNGRAPLHLVPLYTHHAESATVPDSELHELMERNAWRAAMIGLCQPKYEKDVATPELAAEHLRQRLRRTAAPQPPEGARVVDGLPRTWRTSIQFARDIVDAERDCRAPVGNERAKFTNALATLDALLAAPTLAGKEGA